MYTTIAQISDIGLVISLDQKGWKSGQNRVEIGRTSPFGTVWKVLK